MGPCQFPRLAAAAAAVVGVATAAYVLVVRPWHQRWGTSAGEADQPLAGDDLVPSPRLNTTRAIEIAAPAEQIWPWLVQLGTGRAGWYSYDVLENLMGLNVRSANEIVAAYQDLKVGDVIPAAPPPYLGFLVRRADPPESLVTSTSIDIFSGRSIEPGDRPNDHRLDASWTFVLRRLDGDRCRLIARLRARYAPGLLNALGVRAILEPAHFVMERSMLLGIKRRAEAARTN